MPTVQRLIESTPSAIDTWVRDQTDIDDLGLVKTLNAAVCFFKEAIRTDDKATTAMVMPPLMTLVKHHTHNQCHHQKSSTFSSNCSIDAPFWNLIKIKQPAAILQNRDGIRNMLLVEWLGRDKEINQSNCSDPTARKRFPAPFFVCRPNPENQIRNGNNI